MKQDNDTHAAAVALGRRGGQAKSDRKTAANRANARKPRPGARKPRPGAASRLTQSDKPQP